MLDEPNRDAAVDCARHLQEAIDEVAMALLDLPPALTLEHPLVGDLERIKAALDRRRVLLLDAAWRCPCGQQDLARRYGGPADHHHDPAAPCEACVRASFAEGG